MIVNVPVSVGELADKISILRIKSERISDQDKLKNINRELSLLNSKWNELKLPKSSQFNTLIDDLKVINEELWDIEDSIRDRERSGNFGPSFIKLARDVYITNDLRSSIKKEINILSGSDIVEEKSYKKY